MKFLIIIFILLYTSLVHAQATTTGNNDDYYATNANDVTDGLVLWWPGRHQGMSYAQDVSSYKVQGTITGASWGTGTGRGLDFDGVNDYVSFGDQTQFNFGTNTSFTAMAWIYSDAYPYTFAYVFHKIPTNGTGWYLKTGGSWWGGVIVQGTGTTVSVSIGNQPTFVRVSKHVALRLNRTTQILNFFVDGINSATTTTNIGAGEINNNTALGIGTKVSSPTGQNVQGNIDDARIYNRALSNDEINRIYVSNPH